MILTRTPLRISLVGGGTDLQSFYSRHYGAVVSFGIDKYVYVALNSKFDGETRVSYSMTEEVRAAKELKHELVKGALEHFGIPGGVEIATIADIPSRGSGLGSSSALMVGLVTALRKFIHKPLNVHPCEFAQEAYQIERIRCLKSVGKQDHYAAAYGGLHYFQFEPNEDVIVQNIPLSDDGKRFLENDLLLFYTGRTRQSEPILQELEQNLAGDKVVDNLGMMLADMAGELLQEFAKGNFGVLGQYLHEGWLIKKRMARGVSDPEIDELYEKGLRAGASGGKLLGAGGGGFLLFSGGWEKWRDIERALEPLRRVHFKIDTQGAKVVYPLPGG